MVAQLPLDMSSDAVTLRPRGIGRYFEAAFLGVWLTGWLIGETVAIGALASVLLSLGGVFSDSRWTEFGRSAAQAGVAFVLVFLAVWLTGWTVGGPGGVAQASCGISPARTASTLPHPGSS